MRTFARQLRLAERRAQAPYGRGPLGGGMFGGKAAPPPLVPISDAFWASGGWWDLSTIAGVNGAPFASTVPPTSATGLGVFTPGFFTGPTNPAIYDQAIGGKRGLVTSQVINNYLENDALAAVLNGVNKQWSVYFDYQQNNLGVATVNNVIIGWGSAGGIGAQDNFKVNYNEAGGTPQSLSILQATGAGFVASQNNLSQVVAYDYFRFGMSYDGANLTTMLNGLVVAVVPTTLQTAVMTLTKMMWGAWPVNGVGFNASNGYLRRLGVRGFSSTVPQMQQVDSNMVANDVILPQTDPRTPQFIVAGASVINGATDLTTAMGVRYPIAKFIQDNRLSWTSLGTASGFFALRNTTAVSGADAPSITAQIAGVVTSRTKMIVVDLGDEEIDLNQTALQVEAAITLALHNIRTAVYAVSPNCDIAVNTIIPLSEAPLNTVCIAVNAQLPTIWTNSDAEFSTRRPLIRWDANTAIGGPAYVQANYTGGGNDHPNNTGYTLMGTALIAAIGARLIASSPTH